MKNLLNPHITFILLALLFLSIGIINNIDVLNIYTKNTLADKNSSFTTQRINLYALFIYLLGIVGFVYWILKKQCVKLIHSLVLSYALFSTIGILLVSFPNLIFKKNLGSINLSMRIGMIVFLVAQILFVINILLGIRSKKSLIL